VAHKKSDFSGGPSIFVQSSGASTSETTRLCLHHQKFNRETTAVFMGGKEYCQNNGKKFK
jgi:hypothetical protein